MVSLGFSRRVLCLDWDKRSLRILVARIGVRSMRLEDAHSHRIPANVDCEDPAAMGPFIRQCLTRHRLRFQKAIVDIPRDRAVLKRLPLPPTPDNEIAAAVRFQALKELPFPVDEAAIDFAVMHRDEKQLATEILLAAVRTEVITRLRDTLAAAGLAMLRVGLRPYGNLASVKYLAGLAEKRVLLVDVGPSATEIDVFAAGAMAFSRAAGVVVPFAAGPVLSEHERMSSKADLAVQLSDEEESAAVQELTVEVTRTLQAYRATEPNAVIDQILVAGGTGVERALSEALGKRFNLPAALFDVTQAVSARPDEAAKLRAFSAVLGLAHTLARDGQLELDFLNPKRTVTRQETLRRRMQIYVPLAALTTIVLIGWVVREFWTLNSEISALTAQVNAVDGALTTQLKEVVRLSNRVLEADDWKRESEMSVWLPHLLAVTQAAVDPGKQMLVESINVNAAQGAIDLRVLATSWDVALGFVKQINETRVDGKTPYRAAAAAWQESRNAAEPKFRGKVDVKIELLDLRKFQGDSKQREKDRKKLLDV